METNSRNLNNKFLRKLKDSIFQISHAVHDADNIDILFKEIHKEIASLVHTNNFYIALFEKENNTISFPYYVDINDSIPKESIELGLGITSLIIKSSKPYLLNKCDYLKLVEENVISKIGTPPESFLGVPLILHKNQPIGILAIQSYTKDIIFDQNDLEIICFIAEQVGLALEKFNHIEQLEKSSKFDDLTQLPNKAFFFDIALQKTIQNDSTLLFVLIDIDDFMLFIDNYGEEIGNKIIQKISLRLKNIINEDETVSYWGGDKFNLILKSNSEDNLDVRIRDVINVVKDTIKIENHEFQVNSSIGVSIFPNDSKNINKLIRNSEIAMNYVKNNGKNNYKFYKHSIKDDLMEQFGIEVGLRKAIENEQWEIYYQPKFNSSNSIYGFEALIRWIHPQRGIISPLEFSS